MNLPTAIDFPLLDESEISSYQLITYVRRKIDEAIGCDEADVMVVEGEDETWHAWIFDHDAKAVVWYRYEMGPDDDNFLFDRMANIGDAPVDESESENDADA